jgi:glutamate carboxypeptidase
MTQESGHGVRLNSYFEEHVEEMVEFLGWLVRQESMSRVPEATTRIAEEFGARLRELGAAVELIRDAHTGASILARFDHPCKDRSAKQLLLVGHLDTVWPLGTLDRQPFRVDNGLAYGPGTFDMKAGLTIAFFAMRALKEAGYQTMRPVALLVTCDEETGSLYNRAVIEAEGSRSQAALVLEPPIPGGSLKTGRKGVGEFELTITGKPAHAGNDPRGGISAITELAHQILAINAMSDYERGTTLNVGVVSGGILSNVIPAQARARIDMRYQTAEEGARITQALQRLSPVLDGAHIEIRGGINRPPLLRTPAIEELFQRARRLAAEIGFEVGEGSVGGGSDGNFIAAHGVPVLDGLGVDGAGAHAEHEHVIISDIPRRAALLARLIETV